MRYVSLRKQQGVVLLWALGILLVLTIVSVSSVRVSTTNTIGVSILYPLETYYHM